MMMLSLGWEDGAGEDNSASLIRADWHPDEATVLRKKTIVVSICILHLALGAQAKKPTQLSCFSISKNMERVNDVLRRNDEKDNSTCS